MTRNNHLRRAEKEAACSPEYVAQILYVDPEDPQELLRWRAPHPKSNARVGDVAGGLAAGGYLRVRIGGVLYFAHRLRWALAYGAWPVGQLDHIDGDPSNNRLGNLREVSNKENSRNRRRLAWTTAPIPGVFWARLTSRWRVRIYGDTGPRHLGYFDNLLDAVAARYRAERELGYHPNHGRNQ